MGQPEFGNCELRAAQSLIAAALSEDLGEIGDRTGRALIDSSETGRVQIVSRSAGVLAGLPVARQVFAELDSQIVFRSELNDGVRLNSGSVVASLSGPLQSLLIGERTALNFLSHLSGVATLTSAYVQRVADTSCQLLDTRKTLPGYRSLQKYAVRCGGGTNHRLGLHDGILIKDNHLAAWSRRSAAASVADAVRRARQVDQRACLEVEVDAIDQLHDALDASPDIVLLDNMSLETLRSAVAVRNQRAAHVQLEASGGITLETVAQVAATGVDRISVGAITHSAAALDLGFDWVHDR
ncbi:MAG: carboxylating nicotinate-nucleotide diphosphorylase [Planctomycetaceae bacterium]